MNQLLITEFFVKDQASVTTVLDILRERRLTVKEAGCHKLERYIDQDDPNHLVYIACWESRGHFDAYLEWVRAQPNNEQFRACWGSPPRHTWLDEAEAFPSTAPNSFRAAS